MRIIEPLEPFYCVEELANNTNAPYILSLKEIKSDKLKSKLALENHLLIMEKYHNLIVFMAKHLPYLLKSQLVEILRYDRRKSKSRAFGYNKVKELEKSLIIGVEKYNSAEYVFLSYRAYHYLGISRSKNPIERKPSENVLVRHFIRAEIFIRKPHLQKNEAERGFYRYYDEYYLSDSFKNNEEEVYSKFYYLIGALFDSRLKDNWLSYKSLRLEELLVICPDPYHLDSLNMREQTLFFSKFVERMLTFFSRRCSIYMYKQENTLLSIEVNMIYSAFSSLQMYESLFEDLEIFFRLFILWFKSVGSLKIKIYTLNAEEKEQCVELLRNMKEDKRVVMHTKYLDIIDLNVSKRYQKRDSYESSSSKPYKILIDN